MDTALDVLLHQLTLERMRAARLEERLQIEQEHSEWLAVENEKERLRADLAQSTAKAYRDSISGYSRAITSSIEEISRLTERVWQLEALILENGRNGCPQFDECVSA